MAQTLPVVRPLMIPSRHLRENIILFFPPEERLLFLSKSNWGIVKYTCLGTRRPFPNATLADKFIFWNVCLNLCWQPHGRTDVVCIWTDVLQPPWGTSSPLRGAFPLHKDPLRDSNPPLQDSLPLPSQTIRIPQPQTQTDGINKCCFCISGRFRTTDGGGTRTAAHSLNSQDAMETFSAGSRLLQYMKNTRLCFRGGSPDWLHL